MITFTEEWENIVINFLGLGEAVSTELKPLIKEVYLSFTINPLNLHQSKASLEKLLEYLTTPTGRTDQNCKCVNWFFLLAEGIEGKDIPEPIRDIVEDMAGALHDTVSHPEVAENFYSLPEQLLERLRNVEIKE